VPDTTQRSLSLSDSDDRAVHRGAAPAVWETWRYGIFGVHAGVTAVAKIQAGPGDADARFAFSAFEGDRALCMVSGTGVPFREEGDVRAAGPLQMRCVTPNREWHVDLVSGDVEAHLTWTALSEPYAWAWPHGLETAHHEHSGRIEGTLRIGERRFVVTGFAQRERTWGLTRSSVAQHGFSSRVFYGEDAYSHQAIVTVGRRDYLFGFAHAGGQTAAVRRLDVTIAGAHRNGPPLAGTIELEDADGRIARHRYEGGAVVQSVQPSPAGVVTRSYGFPRFSSDRGETIGQIDAWWSDPSLVRPHLVAMSIDEERV
jgi:hypothetical protein